MKASVLVIDDSVTVRQQVAAILVAAGYDVIEAGDGLAGLEAAGAHAGISMILCDVNMPRMDGIEFLEKFKGEHRAPSVPVVMLTTNGTPDLIAQAKRAGARGWIVKPFQADLLVGAVRRIVGDAARNSAAQNGILGNPGQPPLPATKLNG
jgi:two-component system chemotaxis response regulator CheY